MKLIRYQTSPLYTARNSSPTLGDELDRIFEAAFPALTYTQARPEFPVDLYEDKDAFTVRAELPGFRKEDVGVDLADGTMTVTGLQKSETKSGDKEAAAQERRVSRAISLPENVDVEKIRAAYENGVLTITLPKREEVKPKQINVEIK